MFTRIRFIRSAMGMYLILVGALSMTGIPAFGQADKKVEPQTVTDQQRAGVDAAKTVDELMNLGKKHVIKKRYVAARLCVDKICTLDPELLTSTKRQSPTSWHNFWFGEVALLHEKKLKKDDAPGRVELALWLKKAKMTKLARQMLTAALEIDNNLPKAKELADQWNLYGGGPVRFDLTYGLTQPLLLESFSDGGEAIKLRKGRGLLLLPFAYTPEGTRLTINSSYLKVTGDGNKSCSVKGILLLDDGSSGSYGQASDYSKKRGRNLKQSELRLRISNQSLLRRVMITPRQEDGAYELKIYSARKRSSARNKSGTPGYKGYGGTKEKEPLIGSGYAAFLVEVPSEINYLDCEYRGLSPVRIGIDLLEMLAVQANKLSGQDFNTFLEALSAKVKDKYGPVALAAVGKLAQIRSGMSGGGGISDPSDASAGIAMKIDGALVDGLGHSDRWTGRYAVEALVFDDQPIHEATLQMIQALKDKKGMLSLLDRTQSVIDDISQAEYAGRTDRSQSMGYSRRNQNELVGELVGALKPSIVPPNVYKILAACMNCKHDEVRERALGLVLGDGTRYAILSLLNASAELQKAVVPRLAKIEDDELRAAILRVLMSSADDNTLSKLIDACAQISVVITADKDPLLTTLAGDRSAEVIRKLIDLLSQADMTEVIGSESLGSVLKTLEQERQKQPAVWSAMLNMALKQFNLPYEAPVSGGLNASGQSRSARRLDKRVTGFESLLASVAAGPKKQEQEALIAGEALVKVGRLSMLKKRLKKDAPKDRCLKLIQHLSKNKELWNREALSAFIASCLITDDVPTIQAAFKALDMIYQGVDKRQRWRVNLAIKYGIDTKRLVNLSLYNKEAVAQKGTDLLVRLAGMPAEQAEEFRFIPGEQSREDMLKKLDQERTNNPSGKYVCVLYVDVQSDEQSRQGIEASAGEGRAGMGGQGAWGRKGQSWKSGSSAGKKTQSADSPLWRYSSRRNIPLVVTTVKTPMVLQSGDANGRRVFFKGRNIVLTDKDNRRGARRNQNQGPISIDAATLLRAALICPDAKQEGLEDMVDLLSIKPGLQCNLQCEKLGTWSGRVSLGASGRPAGGQGGAIFSVTQATVVMEPAGS